MVLDWKWNLKVKGAFRAPQVQSEQLSLQAHTEVNGDLGNTYLMNNSVLEELGVHASWTLHGQACATQKGRGNTYTK